MLIRKFALVITALFIYFTLLPTVDALAAPNLQVKVTTGFNGKAKYGEGLPITVTVENKGDAFTGDLVLDIIESYSLGNGQAIPFEIGAGETKTVQVAVSGLTEDYMYQGSNAQMIHFFEGGWEKGKSIDFKGAKNLKASFMDPSTIFYFTLTNSADRLKVLNQLKQPNQLNDEVVHIVQLKDFLFPSDATAWKMANYIIIDEFVLADLEENQQQALIDYVNAGGFIIVGASDNTVAELGKLGTYLPITLQSSTKSLSPEILKAVTANNTLSNNLTVYDASLNDGATQLLNMDGTLLAAKKQLGSGAIIQTTFSLGDDPLAKDPVYSDLMSTILQTVSVQTVNNMYGSNMKDQLVYELGSTNSLFSSFKVSTPLMISIVVIYMLLIGPLLYILLKRKDKREYAWGLIPLISIIASAAIFGYGAKDRIARPQVQQSSFLFVNEDNSLNGYYAQSLLSNRSGQFAFVAPTSTTMIAQRPTNSFTGQSPNIYEDIMLEKHATNSELTFRDVGYWSVSTLYGETQLQNVGKMDVNLRVEASKAIGTIKNDFPFALKEVSIWSGSKLIKLGDLQPGEQLDVNKEIGAVMLLPILNPYMNQGYGYNTNTSTPVDLIEQRRQSLFSSSQVFNQVGTSPVITAFAEDNLIPIELKDKKVEMSAEHLIIQPFKADVIFAGDFVLPATMFTVNVNTDEFGKYIEPIANTNLEWHLDDGAYNIYWKIPDTIPMDKVTWTQLQIANTDRNSHSIEIWNTQTKAFEEILESRFTVTDNIQDYIDADGVVHYKLHKKAIQGDMYTRLPEVRLKGEVSK